MMCDRMVFIFCEFCKLKDFLSIWMKNAFKKITNLKADYLN